jgi:hypothetical protein
LWLIAKNYPNWDSKKPSKLGQQKALQIWIAGGSALLAVPYLSCISFISCTRKMQIFALDSHLNFAIFDAHIFHNQQKSKFPLCRQENAQQYFPR